MLDLSGGLNNDQVVRFMEVWAELDLVGSRSLCMLSIFRAWRSSGRWIAASKMSSDSITTKADSCRDGIATFATMAVIRRRRKNQPPHHGKSQRIATSSFIRWSSKLKALLRKVAARTTRTLCRRIGSFVPRLSA